MLIAVNDRGARYPITIDPLVQQGGKLVPNDVTPGSSGSQFGDAVAISTDGNTALIGAQIDNSQHGRGLGLHALRRGVEPAGPKIAPQ